MFGTNHELKHPSYPYLHPSLPLPSGADLGAILSEAQLLAVHDLLDARQAQAEDEKQAQATAAGGGGVALSSTTSCFGPPTMIIAAAAAPTRSPAVTATAASVASVTVTMSHIRRALGVARPSLPAAERRRLEALYARFRQARDPQLGHEQRERGGDSAAGKKATLA